VEMKFINMRGSNIPRNVTGILGLNADLSVIKVGDNSEEIVEDNFIKMLKASNVIENEVFAFNIKKDSDSTPSYMDVGFYNTAAMNNPDELIWIRN
jgi:hypothetical protein